MTWNTFAPRLGVLYDLTGDAKTLLKTSYSRYYWQLWTRIGSQATLAGDRMYTYGWSDPNNDGNFTTNELGTLLSVNDPATRPVTIDEDLKPNKTDEFTVAVVRELMANVSFSGTFIYRRDSDLDCGFTRGHRSGVRAQRPDQYGHLARRLHAGHRHRPGPRWQRRHGR